jgi:S1-C subfamily serine protease
MHQKFADATYRIECGNGSGSGFGYRTDTIVVTNHHVIELNLISKIPITVFTESGEKISSTLVSYSPKDQHDFAIIKLDHKPREKRIILQPSTGVPLERGTKIVFAGFPHGIPDLLVQEAIVSAPLGNHAFYIDGSVNGGNSGGPVINPLTNEVIGIITQRRFLGGGDLEAIGLKVKALSNHCTKIAQQGSVELMGINFGEFAGFVGQGLAAISEVIKANANSGIGIGFKIDFVENEYNRLLSTGDV